MLRLFASVLLLTASSCAASTEEAPASGDTCELTCSTKDGTGNWTSIVTCTPRMNARQCKASADNRNLSDAYPGRMKCEAQLAANCKERRE